MDIPAKIYLQVKDEDGETPDEIMWCVDRVHDTDIEYVRVASKEAKIVLCDFYSTVRDIAETADGYDTFEERVMVAIEETSRNLTSA